MRIKRAIYFSLVSSIFLLINVSYLPAAEIYTWTDKDGNLHITKEPPPKGSRLKDVTPYSEKTKTPASDDQTPQSGRAADREGTEKSRQADEAQRKADVAAKEARAASQKASEAAIEAYETKDKKAFQERQVRQGRVSDDDVIKAESEAVRAQEESKKAWEKAKKADKKAKKARELANDSDVIE